MIVDGLHARNVSRGNDRGASLPIVGDDAAQVGDAILDDNVQAHRIPRLFIYGRKDLLAELIVFGRGMGRGAGETGSRLEQVCPRDDADQLLIAQDGKALDALLFHQLHDILERRLLGDGDRLGRHDVLDGAAFLPDKFGSEPARTREELQPSRPAMPRANLAAANEISFRDDADELAGGIDTGRPLIPFLSISSAASAIGASAGTVTSLGVMI